MEWSFIVFDQVYPEGFWNEYFLWSGEKTNAKQVPVRDVVSWIFVSPGEFSCPKELLAKGGKKTALLEGMQCATCRSIGDSWLQPAGGHEPSPTIARAFQDVRGDETNGQGKQVDFSWIILRDVSGMLLKKMVTKSNHIIMFFLCVCGLHALFRVFQKWPQKIPRFPGDSLACGPLLEPEIEQIAPCRSCWFLIFTSSYRRYIWTQQGLIHPVLHWLVQNGIPS